MRDSRRIERWRKWGKKRLRRKSKEVGELIVWKIKEKRRLGIKIEKGRSKRLREEEEFNIGDGKINNLIK